MPNLDFATQLAHRIGRKPNIFLTGAFDVGKSTLANWIMTSNNTLPTQYQPTTAVITYVRHLQDKPAWLTDDVVLLRKGFDPELWTSEMEVRNHFVASGNLDALRQYGTHFGTRFASSGAETALVFLDRPILQACNLIDFPGYQNTEEDSHRADSAIRNMHVLIYASTATGFMNAQDMERFRYLLKQLPQYERISPGFPALGNLFIVATHAGPQIADDQLFGAPAEPGLLDTATSRIWRELKDIELAERSAETGTPIDPDVVRSRIFPFWRENTKRSEPLAISLQQLLSVELPVVIHGEADRQTAEFKQGAQHWLGKAITSYEQVLDDIENAKLLFAQRENDEPDRKRRVKELHGIVIDRIDRIRKAHLEAFALEYAECVDASMIEKAIHERYGDNKKEAQQFMAGYIVNDLQARSERFAKRQQQEISTLVERYVSIYDQAAGIGVSVDQHAVEIPFDSRGSFIGGLASLGSIGALSIWAASLGNLGGYIIAAKAVGVLSALGIATGGTASVMALLSAIGGPITLGIGLAAALFFGFRALFGDSWQVRLARQITERFKKEGVEEAFKRSISCYWSETLAAFENAAKAVERDFVDEMRNLGAVHSEPKKRQEAVHLVSTYKKAKDFFVGMPWIPLRPRQKI
jgi:hypothetical protein